MKHGTYEILSTLVCLDNRNVHTANLMNTNEGFTLFSDAMRQLHRFSIVVDMCKPPEQNPAFSVNVLITMPDLTRFRGFEGINEEYKTSRILRDQFMLTDFYQDYLCDLLNGEDSVSLTFTDEDELVAFARSTIDACGETFYNSEYSELFDTIKDRLSEINVLKALLINQADISKIPSFDYVSDRKFTLSFGSSEIYCNTCLSVIPPIVTEVEDELKFLTCECCGMSGMVDDWLEIS